jgi:CBS domain-containing protein
MTRNPHGPVSTIMSWPVATIDHDATVQEAAEALAADDLGALLVLREGDPAGIVSERDVIAHVAAGSELGHLHAGEVMAGDLITVQADASVLDAARAMAEAGIRHLPVLQGRLIAGMVSIRDLLPVLADAVGDEDVVVVPSGTRVVVRTP